MVKEPLQDMDDISSDEMIVRKKKMPEKKTGVTAASVLRTAADALDALRAKRPLVHCLSEHVAAYFSANALKRSAAYCSKLSSTLRTSLLTAEKLKYRIMYFQYDGMKRVFVKEK